MTLHRFRHFGFVVFADPSADLMSLDQAAQ
jgi:hypothetical protein